MATFEHFDVLGVTLGHASAGAVCLCYPGHGKHWCITKVDLLAIYIIHINKLNDD